MRIDVRPRIRNSHKADAARRFPSHLKWIRGRPCILEGKFGHACEGKMEAMHVDGAGGKGMGLKVADYKAVPGCSEAHRLMHQYGAATWQATWGVNLDTAWRAYASASPHKHLWAGVVGVMTDNERCPSGRATHERSLATQSPPTVGIPNAHTPGPWTYRPLKRDDWGIVRADGHIICQARDPRVPVEELDRARTDGIDPWEANARLISAGPDLLDALEAAWLGLSNPTPALATKIMAAMAKARGEA